jgi:hypothetical protein
MTALPKTAPGKGLPRKRSLFYDATPLLDDPVALRARAEQDGYLFSSR